MLQARKEFLKGVRLSDWFYDELKKIDSKCTAVYDPYHEGEASTGLILPESCKPKGAIHISAERKPGLFVHELTVKRKSGESNASLERRSIHKLKECDVWKKFGDGKKYDEYLFQKDTERKEKLEKEAREKRVGNLLDKEGETLDRLRKEIQSQIGTCFNPKKEKL